MSRRFGRVAVLIVTLAVLLPTVVTAAQAQGPMLWSPIGDGAERMSGNRWGSSMSLSADGSRVAVGDSTAARVFDVVAGTWGQVGADLDLASGVGGHKYDVSLSADGARVAVGAGGGVAVFDLVGGDWSQVGDDLVGAVPRLSADGSRLAVIVAFDVDPVGDVQVFDLVDGVWVQVGFDIPGGLTEVRFRPGMSLKLSADGSRLAVGIIDDGSAPAGYVRIFELVDGAWSQIGADLVGAGGDDFGGAVSLSADGSRMSVGAPGRYDGQTGYVRVFDDVGGSWSQVGGDLIGNAATGGKFGRSVSLSGDGNRLAIGDPSYDGGGRVSVFDLTSGAWQPVAPPITGNPLRGTGSRNLDLGAAVSLSADGSRVAVGDPGYGGPFNQSVYSEDGQAQVFGLFPAGLCQGRVVTIDMNVGGSGLGTLGDDVILGTPGDDVINGLRGDDTICGEGGDDILIGATGDDEIHGGAGNDTITGYNGNDILIGSAGDDEIHAGAGNDTIHGNRGDDELFGDDGDDRIFGYAGNDTIDGGDGEDRLHGNFGDDVISGGEGNDRIFGYGDSDTLSGGAGDDLLTGNFGDDVLDGGDGNDVLYGADGDDIVNGGPGNDILNGNSLNDTLNGGAGNDTLDGGIDTDTCNGDAGFDTATRCETITGVP